MKNNKFLFVLVGLFLLFSAMQLTSAYKYNCCNEEAKDYTLRNGDNVIFILRNVDSSDDYDSRYWENEDRFPLYTYREGYSYRATRNYQRSVRERVYSDSYLDTKYTQHNLNNQRDSDVETYYTYDDYMRKYTKHECYINPPKDKLFYIKCP